MMNFRHAHIDALAAQLIELAPIESLHPSFGHVRESRVEMIRERFDKALLFSFPLAAWEKMPNAETRRRTRRTPTSY
jgi:hypothetical protein